MRGVAFVLVILFARRVDAQVPVATSPAEAPSTSADAAADAPVAAIPRKLGLIFDAHLGLGPSIAGGSISAIGADAGALVRLDSTERTQAIGLTLGWFGYSWSKNGRTTAAVEGLRIAPRWSVAWSRNLGFDAFAAIGISNGPTLGVGAGVRLGGVVRADLELLWLSKVPNLDNPSSIGERSVLGVVGGATFLFDEGWRRGLVASGLTLATFVGLYVAELSQVGD